MRASWARLVPVCALSAAALAGDRKPEPKIERKLGAAVTYFAISPDGKWIGAYGGSFVALFSAEKSDRRLVADYGNLVTPPFVAQVLFTGDSRFFVFVTHTSGFQSVAHAVDPATAKEVRTVTVPGFGDLEAVPGGSKVESVGGEAVHTWDLATGNELAARPATAGTVARARSSAPGLSAELSSALPESLGTVSLVEEGAAQPRWTFDVAVAARGSKGSDGTAPKLSALTHLCGFTADATHLIAFLKWDEGKDPSDPKRRSFARVAAVNCKTGALAWTRDVSCAWWHVVPAAGVVGIVDDGKLEFVDETNGRRDSTAPAGDQYVAGATSDGGRVFWVGTKNGNIRRLKTLRPADAK